MHRKGCQNPTGNFKLPHDNPIITSPEYGVYIQQFTSSYRHQYQKPAAVDEARMAPAPAPIPRWYDSGIGSGPTDNRWGRRPRSYVNRTEHVHCAGRFGKGIKKGFVDLGLETSRSRVQLARGIRDIFRQLEALRISQGLYCQPGGTSSTDRFSGGISTPSGAKRSCL